MKAAQWILIVGCWLLIAELLSRAAGFACKREYLQFGPEKIVGAHCVVYQKAPDYLYTNPTAMIRHGMKCTTIQWGMTLPIALLATGLIWKILKVRRFQKKSIFTVTALITTIVLLEDQRIVMVQMERNDDAFWDSTAKCTGVGDFISTYGEPVIYCKNISSEDEEWFNELVHFHTDISLSGKDLYGFVSPQMKQILLLPIFNDEGIIITFAWCYLTPERRELLAKRQAQENTAK
ncbi:MAG: hypothetical protein K5787_05500 [Lentisphaeria bacterium]|nr:hypothetical protein [Lentisphaeria bacterium]